MGPPDSITFFGLLTACTAGILIWVWTIGKQWCEIIGRMTRRADNSAGVIDILGRVDRLEEALEMI
jgi:hypothetical protein